jgi:hypothetical protein
MECNKDGWMDGWMDSRFEAGMLVIESLARN